MPILSLRPVGGVLTSLAVVVTSALPAFADDTTTTTSTTTSSSSSTSTTSSTTTSSTRPTATTTSSTSTTTTTTPPEQLTPEQRARIDDHPRSAGRSSSGLVDALAELPPAVAVTAFGRFPVAGDAKWSDDWLLPRHSPELHLHQGTDVFADRGTPVLSPAMGAARISHGGSGGLAVTVVQDDGTYWYLAHLDTVTVAAGDEVAPGTMVGTVGDTGNAKGSAPHVHVEVHPHGGEPVDPKALLDQCLDEAYAGVPAVIDEYRARAIASADRLDRQR